MLSESLQLIPAPLRIYQQNSGTLSKNPELSWSEVKMVRRKMVRISVFHCMLLCQFDPYFTHAISSCIARVDTYVTKDNILGI